jgi:GNAT superfamily N-acetyltransferase
MRDKGRSIVPDVTAPGGKMALELRAAHRGDVAGIERLMAMSARALLVPWYSSAQIDAALGSVFAVDDQLLEDGTYFVAMDGLTVVGCGGWSRRRTLFGAARSARPDDDSALDPARDPARIRAFFVHPAFARRGIGASLMRHSERGAAEAGFRTMELVATLGGRPLYARSGFAEVEHLEIPLSGSLTMAVVRMRKRIAPAE